MSQENPLIVQSDMTLLLEVNHPLFNEISTQVSHFAELIKNLEHLNAYNITSLSIWNSASSGFQLKKILDTLKKYTRYPIPSSVIKQITQISERYGKIHITKDLNQYFVETDEEILMLELRNTKSIKQYLEQKITDTKYLIKPMSRGLIKMELINLGYPAQDIAGYVDGAPLSFKLAPSLNIRDYQKASVNNFYSDKQEKGGSGVIVLPCGSGKTIVGILAMEKCQSHTLILTTNVIASKQWKSELLNKTSLKESQIAEYNGSHKEIADVTIATYQILSYREKKNKEFKHFDLFEERRWGLIIYDEVHLLPAPLFRLCANVQATRRLGLTATLIREDNKEKDVFSLIGPQKYNLPWKQLESQGWIATAHCSEVRIPIDPNIKMKYVIASIRDKNKIAATNPYKTEIVKRLLKKHTDANVIIIGQYIDQLKELQKELQLPLIMGVTPNAERLSILEDFRQQKIKTIILSKVGNFAIDLPNANILIQISGAFGSRQEEAQRLGRLLRPNPKENRSEFYSIITQDTREQDFAMNRQLFLVEQGYDYSICYEKI